MVRVLQQRRAPPREQRIPPLTGNVTTLIQAAVEHVVVDGIDRHGVFDRDVTARQQRALSSRGGLGRVVRWVRVTEAGSIIAISAQPYPYRLPCPRRAVSQIHGHGDEFLV